MATPWPMMRFGKMEGGGELSPTEKERADDTFQDYLEIQDVLDVTDGFTTLPNASMEETFDYHIRHAQDWLSNIFFGYSSEKCIIADIDHSKYRNKMGCILVANSVSKVMAHDYYKAIDGNEARTILNGMIYSEDGIELGRSLLTQDLIDHHGFQLTMDYKNRRLPMLEKLFQDEVYIIGTIAKQCAANVSLPAKMKFFVLQALGSTKLDEIADIWIRYSSKELIQPILDFVYEHNHLEFVSAWLKNDPYFIDVQVACTKYSSYSDDNYIYHIYGDEAYKWLRDWYGPKQYNLHVDELSVQYKVAEPTGGGCFLPGTMVIGKDGKEISIEDLKEDDLILGRAGNVAVISSEKAGLTVTSDTPAFAFNDEEPFFLSSHPFWTQDGWRAINPITAKEENQWFKIGLLVQGDYVCKVKSINYGDLEYEWIKIRKINMKMYPAGTRLYGIHTREGPRSYHANNYLVMQNYPEITAQKVVDRMSKLDKKTQQKIREQLKRIKPTLEHVLGAPSANVISALAEKKVVDKLMKKDKPKNSIVNSKDFTLPPLALQYDKKALSYGSYTMPDSLIIQRRQCFVGRQFVKEMSISDDLEVTWCRKVAAGLWEHGCIKLYDIGFYGKGHIALTKNKDDKVPLLIAKVKASFKVNVYNCFKSNEEVEVPDEFKKRKWLSKGNLTWYPCGSFEMGFKFDPESTLYAAVDIGDLGGRDEVDGNIKLNSNAEGRLTINIDLPPLIAEYAQHTTMYAVFDPFFQTFQGYCTEYDESSDDRRGKSYGWRGEYDHYEERSESLIEMARKEQLKSSMHSKTNIGLSIQQLRKDYEARQTAVLSSMTLLLKSQLKSDLSLDDLFLITPPDPSELHDRTFELLQKCMKYEMADEDREAVLGDSKPILSGEEEEVAEAHKEFLGTRFAHCYLMNALSTMSDFDDRISEVQRNKLLYFFAGHDEEGCLSRDEDYNAANNDLARLAFISLATRVQDYIDDDGPGWAQKLHEHITTPDMLLNFALITEVDQDTAKIQKQAMVLYCLDPDKDLGQDFYTKVMMAKLQNNSEYFNGDKDDEELLLEICGDMIAQIIQIINAGSDPTIADIKEQCQKELQELAEELKIHGQDLLGGVVNFVSALITSSGYDGSYWNRYFAKGKEIIEKITPKINGKALKWMAGMTLTGVSFLFSIQAFTRFDQLRPEEKAALILDATTATLTVFNKGGPVLLDKFEECFNKGKGDYKFASMLGDAKKSEGVIVKLSVMTETGASAAAGESLTVEQAIGRSMIDIEGDLAAVESRWTKAFKMAGKLAKLTGVIASFVGAISIGLQIFRDIKNGENPAVISFEIIECAAFSMVAICEVMAFAIECEAIPIVGQVCAIVGLVASIILLFVHRNPPDPRTPAQIYCDDRGGPYIDTLKEPTQEWLDEYHEQHPDDPDEGNKTNAERIAKKRKIVC